jgi:hypothetical protein
MLIPGLCCLHVCRLKESALHSLPAVFLHIGITVVSEHNLPSVSVCELLMTQ